MAAQHLPRVCGAALRVPVSLSLLLLLDKPIRFLPPVPVDELLDVYFRALRVFRVSYLLQPLLSGEQVVGSGSLGVLLCNAIGKRRSIDVAGSGL